MTRDGRPNREFYVGISVRRGRGKHRYTHMVTVAPRFLLINKSRKHKLVFAQKHTVNFASDAGGNNMHLTAMPGRKLPGIQASQLAIEQFT